MTTDERTPAGVIGVGSMGRHHARIYREHPEVELVGVTDEDREQAAAVAEEYGTVPRSQPELLSMAELVSVAVPTEAHYPVAKAAIEAGVSVLVEKPFVRNLANGRDLCRRAAAADVTLQVGHVERFNPAVQAMFDVVEDMNVIAIDARRLGPPLDRDLDDNVVMDLMIHDIDIVLASLDSAIASTAATAAHGGKHVVAQVTSGDGVVADLTASRVTQKRVRELSVTAEEGLVTLDYGSQDLRIHRQSLPEYYADDGDLGLRHEHVVERPTVESGEPLKRELSAFLDAHRSGDQPVVTGEQALNTLRIVHDIEEQARTNAVTRPKQ
jgi:predicted dehydrogenase